MWKMIAPPKRDDMFDFPGIPFVVALNQHLSSVFLGGSGPIHLLRAYAKAYASLRGLRGCLRDHKSASTVQVSKCTVAAPARKSQLFSASAVLAAPALRSEMQYTK